MIARAFVDTNIYIYALTKSQDQGNAKNSFDSLTIKALHFVKFLKIKELGEYEAVTLDELIKK